MTFKLSIESTPEGLLKVDIVTDEKTYTFTGSAKDMKADYKPKQTFDDTAVVELYDRFCTKHGKITITPRSK